MKKLFMLLGAMMLVCSLGSAASLLEFCTPNGSFNWISVAAGTTQSVNSTSQTASISCPGLSGGTALPGGDSLVSVEVYYLADWSLTTVSGTTILDTFENPSGGGWGATQTTGGTANVPPYECVSTGNGNSSTGVCVDTGGLTEQQEYSSITGLSGTTFSAFSVAVTATLVQGGINSSTYDAIVEFDYSTPTPEPASLLMVGGGAGLLGLAQLVGRYLKKRS
jgi:hypothetical protein